MVKKLHYQAVSKTLFVPAATIAVFSSFSQPVPPRIKIAVESAGAVNAPVSPAQPPGVFSQFAQTVAPRKPLPSFTNAPQPSFVQPYVFSAFNEPLSGRTVLPDEQPSPLFEVEPPPLPPFTGFASFEGILRAKYNVALLAEFTFILFTPVVDTHDGVWVKRKKRRSGPDPIELELEEKAKRRAALELAIYGPEVEYSEPPVAFHAPTPVLPDVTELARVVASAQAAHHQTLRARDEQDEETELESILREIL